MKAINKSNHYKVHFSLDATRFAANLLFSHFAKPHIANQTPEPTETAKSFLGIFSTVNATPFFFMSPKNQLHTNESTGFLEYSVYNTLDKRLTKSIVTTEENELIN